MRSSLGSDHWVLTDYARKVIRIKARQLVRRPSFSRTDEEDLVQEMTMYLLTHATDFDPSRGEAKSFVSVVIDTAAANLVRKQRRKASKPDGVEIQSLASSVDLPGVGPVQLDSLISIEDMQRRTRSCSPNEIELLDDKDAFESAFTKLPGNLKRICNELMSVSPAVAARNLGINRHQMINALETIREYFSGTGFEQS